MTGATSPRVEWSCAFIYADYENEFCSGVPDAGIARIGCGFLAIPDNPPFPPHRSHDRRRKAGSECDGWTVVVALNTVGSSEPTR